MRAVSFIWLAMIFAGTAAAQGPVSGFMNRAGTTDIAFGYAREQFDEYLFGRERQEVSLATDSWNLFVEHSFSNGGAVVLNIPYLIIDETNRGLQDGSLFLKIRNRYREYEGGSLSNILALGITTPLSAYPTGTDNPIGLGAFAFQGRYLLQYNTDYGFFLQLKGGADFRFLQQLQTSIPLLLRGGFGARHYFVEGWVEWYNTLNNGVDRNVTGGSGADWWRLGLTAYAPVYGGLGVAANAAWIVAGQNIGLSGRYGLSLVYRRQAPGSR